MMYVPEGFAHGFQTLTDNVELLYMHSEFYDIKSEGGLTYNDQSLKINWPDPVTNLSTKDKTNLTLNQLKPIQL